MHPFSTLLAGVSALALVAAQSSLIFTSTFTGVTAGQPVQITWSGGDPNSPVTIILRSGDPNNLVAGTVITSSATGGSFSWTPPKDLPNLPNYALEIKQGSLDNFYGPFSLSGGSGTALPTGSATYSLISHSNSTTATTTSLSSSSTETLTSSGNLTSTTTLKTTKSSAKTTEATAPTSGSTTAPNANNAAGFASPLALVLSAVMAMIYFN